MLDGLAILGSVSTPKAWAASSIVDRSGESVGSANAGQRVVTSSSVGCVLGHAWSTAVMTCSSRAAAAVSSKSGVVRTSTLSVHRSGVTEYP